MKPANNHSTLFAFGVNHKTASIEVREKVYIHEHETLELLTRLKETLEECVIVSTCNRTEIYGLHPTPDINFDYYKDLLIDFKNASDTVTREDFFSFISCAACQQLFSVATSIDSKIIGDTQILQQIRKFYAMAKDTGFTGKITNKLFQSALKIGKKTYLETSIHKGAVSISLAAVEQARRTFGSLADKTVLIIGAGETAQLTAECLLKKRVGKIIVTNRTRTNAEDFLQNLRKTHNFNGEAVDFENFRERLNETDIVISSTSAIDYILYPEDFQSQTRKILLFDIAVPRDISPEVVENNLVVLKNVDDLNSMVDANYEKRMRELPQVNRIIFQEMGDFLVWYYSQPMMPDFTNQTEKTDKETINRIKRIRQYLAANAAQFHQMARQTDARSELNQHLSLISQLNAISNSAAA